MIDNYIDELIHSYEGSFECYKTDYLSTGFKELDDEIIGYHKGKIVEISGKESTAKTYLVLKAIECVQRLGGFVIYYDTDHTFSNNYISNFGIDDNRLMLIQPNNGDDILDSMQRIIRTGTISLFIVDSITSISPKCGTGDAIEHLKYVSKITKLISQTVGQHGCYCIFTNQLRDNKSGTTSTGGKLLKFYSYLRLQTSKTNKFITRGEEKIGEVINVKIIKNKMDEEDVHQKTIKIQILYT